MTAVLLVHDDREYLRNPGERLETDLGVLTVPEDVDHGTVIETHLGAAFRVRGLRIPDLFNHLQRTGAPMMPRDIGLVIGLTGIERSDRVLDAGTGTGILAVALGRIGAQVLTFERNPEFAAVARENMATAGVEDTVTVRTADLLAAIESTDDPRVMGPTDDDEIGGHQFDVLTLDTEDAPDLVGHAPDLLVDGGYLAAYCPFVETARATELAARKAGLSAVETRETIQREMDFDDRGSRPAPAGVGHTGYLVLGRQSNDHD